MDGFHIHMQGSSGVPVVLEAGIAASSLSWQRLLGAMGPEQRVVAYDRRGFGWSEAAESPRTLETLASELGNVFEHAGVDRPAVLVGHSFGALIAKRFAMRNPERVAALVLLDPLEPFEWAEAGEGQLKRLGRGVALSRRGAALARVGVVRFSLDLLMSGSLALPKLIAKASSGKGSAVTDRLVGEVRKLPEEVWPAVRAHWCLPKSFLTMAEYLERLPVNCRDAKATRMPEGMAVTVVSGETSSAEVKAAHKAGATRHVTAEGSGHWVQLDRPDIVAREIERLTAAARIE